MFGASSADAIYEGASAHRIDYLFIGEPERSAHPNLERRLDSRPDLFRPVFREGRVRLYYVERDQR